MHPNYFEGILQLRNSNKEVVDFIKSETAKKGQKIANLGDYVDGENGGWSRHLHVQLLRDLPKDNIIPPGYSSKENLTQKMLEYPNPSFLVFK